MSNIQLIRIISILKSNSVNFSLITHESAGQSEKVAKVRGTDIGQGAKALLCKEKIVESPQYILAVIPGDKSLDFKKLALGIGVKKLTLASVDEVYELTGCVPGTVPPISFTSNLKVVADPSLFQRFEEIAFNAGSLNHSIKVSSSAYLNLVSPLLTEIIKI